MEDAGARSCWRRKEPADPSGAGDEGRRAGAPGWSRRLFWKLPAAVSAIRIKPVPGGGGESHCRFLSSQPVPAPLPTERDDIH